MEKILLILALIAVGVVAQTTLEPQLEPPLQPLKMVKDPIADQYIVVFKVRKSDFFF